MENVQEFYKVQKVIIVENPSSANQSLPSKGKRLQLREYSVPSIGKTPSNSPCCAVTRLSGQLAMVTRQFEVNKESLKYFVNILES